MLRSSGNDPNLIQHLLEDAQLLESLLANLKMQVETLHSFRDQYLSQSWRVLHEEPLDEIEKKMKDFGLAIQDLERKGNDELKNLSDASQNIIQLVAHVSAESTIHLTRR